MSLSQNHRESLGTTMMLLEQSLDRVRALLRQPSATKVMYDLRNEVPEERRRRIEGEIEAFRGEIRRFRDDFGLPRGEISVEKSVWGEMPLNWEMIEECRSRRLRGYGEIPQGLPEVLDPRIDRLADLVVRMERLLLPNSGTP